MIHSASDPSSGLQRGGDNEHEMKGQYEQSQGSMTERALWGLVSSPLCLKHGFTMDRWQSFPLDRLGWSQMRKGQVLNSVSWYPSGARSKGPLEANRKENGKEPSYLELNEIM